MYVSTQALVPHSTRAYSELRSPSSLEHLYGREREVAALVYRRGPSGAREVQRLISAPLSNPAVRTTLNRLVRKGILTRLKCGRQGAFIYGAALNQLSAREMELRQFADDFFEGSMERLARAVADLCLDPEPGT